jgi:tetratricopeptide (TPR) repeat protein
MMPLESELLDQGLERLQAGDYEAALELFDKVLAQNPQEPNAWYQKGLALQKLGRYVEAVAANEKFMAFAGNAKKVDQAPELLNHPPLFKISLQPDLLEKWFEQSHQQYLSGDFEGVIASLDKSLEFKPDYHQAWYARGLALSNLNRYEEAISSYDKSLEFKPDYYQAWNNRGAALTKLDRTEEAISSYDKALQFKPDDHQAWNNWGLALAKLNRHEEAISSYDKALQFKPDFHEAWDNRGLALAKLNRHEEAISSYDKALQFKPNYHQAWISRGSALDNLNHHEEAISSYDKALQFKPDDHLAWNNRGNALAKLNRHEEAISSYDKALQFKPDDHLAWNNRGNAVLSSPLFEKFPASVVGATLSQQNPQLKQRGYPGRVITLEFGLTQVILNSEGWCFLQWALGQAYFDQGKQAELPSHNLSPYWQKARHCLELALSVVSEDTFPYLRLQTLRLMIRVLLAQGDIVAAQTYRKAGVTLLLTLLNQAPTSLQKQNLEAEFSGFSQIAVDVWLQAGEPITALETAERYKNRCLTWILEAWQETVISPSYATMQTLCTQDTAVVYWHLSPDSLTTFIFTDKNDWPQVLEGNSASQFQHFTTLMQEWHQDYVSQNFTGTEGENHPWQKNLVRRLDELRQKILQIEAIAQKLPNTVQTIILVPHRKLHLLPLHILFPDRLSCVYLPSLQIGLNLNQKARENNTYAPLLSIEDPATERPPMHFAQLESAIVRHLVNPSTPIGREQATTETVLHNLQQPFATLHFTGHSAYNARTPKASALALSDGLLTAETIAQQDLSSYRLIILSACETALTGNDGIRAEYVGLASAFLKAGATNVLSTLWPVDEISSTWLIIQFYQFLLEGDSPTIALRKAQHWLQTVTWQQLADWITQLSQLPDSVDRKELKKGVVSG